METSIKLIIGGDVMLGRLVNDALREKGADFPLGPIHGLMQSGDLCIINLENAITASNTQWQGAPKAFYFGAEPIAAKSLQNAKVDMVNLSNNHTLDFDVQGLLDSLEHLNQVGIKHTGAGKNLTDALMPAIIDCKGMTFGMVGFCDHQDDFAATESKPGIAYLDLNDKPLALQQFQSSLDALKNANVDWPILSLHWGPNMVNRPSSYFQGLAHDIIDMGYKMLFGHSAHVFHGIEIYKNYPIIYAAGDLVDDYYVDPEFKNDHQLVFEIHIAKGKLSKIKLHPVFISDCQVSPAVDEQFDFIAKRAIKLCQEMGTKVGRINNDLVIRI